MGLGLAFGVLTGLKVDVLPQDMHHDNCMCACVFMSTCLSAGRYLGK